MTTFDNAVVNATFDAIINDVSHTEALLDQGIGDKATARPFALTWAAAKYSVKLVKGQRGLALDQTAKNYEAARKAVQRVLDVCFPAMETASVAAPKESKQADPVAKLLKSFEKLTAAQRKKFLAAV
jgi:hypothetical protein